jgi:hypothetical protein
MASQSTKTYRIESNHFAALPERADGEPNAASRSVRVEISDVP